MVCVAVVAALPVEPPLANWGGKGLEANTIDEMLAPPHREIDIGLGPLLIGKEYDPDLDAAKYLSHLDRMALELRSRIDGETDPRKIISRLDAYVFTTRGYASLREDEAKPLQDLLHVLLDQKRGNRARLWSLDLALAESLGLPLFGPCAGSRPRAIRMGRDENQSGADSAG